MKKSYLKTLLISAFSLSLSIMALGQNPDHRTCGTLENHEFLKQTRRGYAEDFVQYNQMIDQYMKSPQFQNLRTSGTTITIPVVIHVVYNTNAQNISDAQAISQFSVLDNDFNHLNADTVNIPSVFRSVAGKTGIRFCLAVRDPNGNPTTGIVHKQTSVTSFVTDNKVKSSATGGDDPWDVTRYMNIWICPLGNSLLGYGEFPTSSISNTYGLVINYTAAGTMGTAQAPFNKGRTGTHEFGHCFNLNHIWGDNGQCGASDNCTDTPPQKGGTAAPAGCNYGTPTFPLNANKCTRPDGVGGANVTNTNGDMFMNFMDYTDDAAMNMFTVEQCKRMVAVVSTAPWNVLQNSNACTPVTALDANLASVLNPVDGSSSCNNSVVPSITLNNAGSTTITSAIISYKMDATTTKTLNFSGSLASGASTVITLNAYNGLSNAAHTFSVWVSSPNGGTDANSSNNSKTASFTVVSAPAGSALPFVENFESTTFPPTGWVKVSTNTINAANTWSRVSNATGIPVVPATTACARMDNYSSNTDISGQKEALRSPALSFSGANSSLNVTFDVAHKMYGTADIDSLNLYISTDCGNSWIQLYTKGGSQLATTAGYLTTAGYTPASNAEWRRETVSLQSYAGLSSVYLKFEARSGWGNNIYLDNINVTYTTAAVPTASFTTSTVKCAGSSISFTDQSTNSPISWAWSTPGATSSTSTQQNPTVTYNTAGTYSVSLIATNSIGASSVYTQTVLVNALPAVSVTSATICSGSAASISASGATSYSWSTNATSSSISVSPTSLTNYTVTGTTNGCSSSKVATVSVNALPVVSVNNATICSGNSVSLSASGATSYSWSTNATSASISVSPTTLTNYTVVGTTNGCSASKVSTVTVNALPVVSVTSATICSGSAASISASGATSYSWSTNATSSSISVSPTALTNYTVTGTTNGCSSSKVSTVSVKSVPVVSVNNATVCSGDAASLSASGATSYVWSTNATSSSISVSPTVLTNYTVTGTTNGCSNSKVATVLVNTTPVVNVNSPTICSGNSVTLVASGAATYSWNNGATAASISVSPKTNTSYSVIGTTNGCSNSKTSIVSVNTTPTVSVNNATICSGSATSLSASGATSYTWNTNATSSSINVSPTTSANYTVTGTTNGCSDVKVSSVSVNQKPNVTFASVAGPLCSGGSSVSLVGTPTNGTFTGTGVANSSFNPAVSGIGTFTLSYYYTDVNSCSSFANQVVTVNSCTGLQEQIVTPFSIYPNPANEIFNIDFKSNEMVNATIEIFDGIGKLVFMEQLNTNSSTISLNQFAKGIYTIRVKNDSNYFISRLIKE
jgi:PKD repeat protein